MEFLIFLICLVAFLFIISIQTKKAKKKKLAQQEKERKLREEQERQEVARKHREYEAQKKREEEERIKEQKAASKRTEKARLALQKKREDDARIKRKATEAKRKAEAAAREKKRQEKAEKEKLAQLTIKKVNWKEFHEVLESNKITCFYHFTDKANIEGIIKQGGLISWYSAEEKGVLVEKPGGGSLSRSLDRNYGLEDYVRLCFTKNHPMIYVARNEGRIQNPVVLEISTEVALWENTRFSDMNATKNGHSQGKTIKDLKNIRFNVVKQRNHFDLSDDDRPYYQAEVMVKSFIPKEYILNLNNFS